MTPLFLLLAALAPSASPDRVPDWGQSDLEQGNPAVVSMYYYAACARVKRRPVVEALLASRPGSPEERALIPQVFPSGYTDCAVRPSGFRLSNNDLVRGSVAEALYNGDRYRVVATAPLGFRETFPPLSRTDAGTIGKWVARCAVYRAADKAHEVMRWSYGSVGERRALRGLHDVFLNCLPAEQTLAVPRLYMRIFLAEQLYDATRAHPEAFAHA